MKQILLVIAAFALIQNLDLLGAYLGPDLEYDPEVHGEVVLFSTASCTYCKKTRRLLGASGVPYTEYDVERSIEGYRRFAGLGGQGVPVLQVGERTIHGYDPGAIRAAFAR